MIPAGKIRCVTGFDISRSAAPAPSLTPCATAPGPGYPADALQPGDRDWRRHAGTCRAIALAGELIEAAMSEAPACVWCNRPFRVRGGGGRPQRFCRPSCRRSFHAAARSWVLDAITRGVLTIANIRSGLPATRALLIRTEAPTP